MTLREVQALVNQGENEVIEFKRKANHPEKIVKEVVAFANSRGGHLLIGVDDNKTISGLKYADEDIFVLERAILNFCRPRINYALKVIPLSENRKILSFYIHPSIKKPHYVLEDEKSRWGKVYVRNEDKSIQASREVREILRRRRRQKDISFHFGEKEKLLMEYLQNHDHITLKEFSSLAKINLFKSSRTLILLVLANVLEIIPREKEDYYILK
ncbi:AlbA family DNA-binding domain-containing protein [Xanthovirga aplysinae]|uniref:AlbA family DNA-binding domain-containing protein n=1 Tax=Xanthovirga aplysinae TaxID=2529853 RepID=UPI0012BD20BB|nr:ATP-binding protein [Xanthovirga aplysinae]MTI31832.1 ATP-binding protein [Xanthovirga aplysinae]